MPRYLDSGSGLPDDYLGNWLDTNTENGIRGFRLQSGYFRFGALQPYVDTFRRVAEAGLPVHFVLGSNSGSLSRADVEHTLTVVENTAHGTLTVVAYTNAEFHPKVVHLVRADESTAVAVGSGNFTERGLGANVEAFIILDTRNGDSSVPVQAAADAIDRWHTTRENGVYSVQTIADIDALAAAGLINLPQPARPQTPAQPLPNTNSNLTAPASRPRVWRPRMPAPPAIPTPAPVATPVPVVAGTFTRWCKLLARSDAQQAKAGSNPTGKLRLSQSGFPINHQTAFRQELFASETWLPINRNGKTYEVADVDFQVEIDGVSLGIQRLTVDYALHRVAGQGNVSTVLAWGAVIGQRLRAQSYVGFWVVIERDTGQHIRLTIQRNQPVWTP